MKNTRILALFTMLCLAGSLFTACGNDSTSNTESGGNSNVANPPTTTAPPNEPNEPNIAPEPDVPAEEDGDEGNSESEADVYGKNNLIPMKTTVTADIANDLTDEHKVSMSVDMAVRGDEAVDYINSKAEGEGRVTAPDDETKELLVIRIIYTLESTENGEPLKPSRVRIYNEELERYPDFITVGYFNRTDFTQFNLANVEVGETITRYMIYQVDKSNHNILFSYQSAAADYSDGLWFMLYEE